MKTIITTVGTSLFENYLTYEVEELFEDKGKTYTPIGEQFKILKENRKSAAQFDVNGSNEKKIKKQIIAKWLTGVSKDDKNNWQFKKGFNEYASAEIESIIKIQKTEKQKIQVYLICTDTVLSVLAAELIKDFL